MGKRIATPAVLVKPSARYNFDRLWNWVKRDTTLRTFTQHRTDLPLAHDLLRLGQGGPSWNALAKAWLAKTLLGEMSFKGAMYGYESRRWLPSLSGSATSPLALDSTGAKDQWNIYDFFAVDVAGVVASVAVTGTTGVVDFDTYPQPDLGGTVVDEGVTGFGIGAIAVGNGVYRDLSASPKELNPGSSVSFNVTAAATAGDGYAFLVGFPVNKYLSDLSTFTAV